MATQANKPNENSINAAYQAVNQHWSHAEQERWSILYNLLTANTILLLAWAAVYSSQIATRIIVLIVFALAGIMISILWITIGSRVNTFIKHYGQLGEKIEMQLNLSEIGPFHRGELIRSEEKLHWKERGNITFIERLGGLVPSRVFVLIVPTIFAFIHLTIFTISLIELTCLI